MVRTAVKNSSSFSRKKLVSVKEAGSWSYLSTGHVLLWEFRTFICLYSTEV